MIGFTERLARGRTFCGRTAGKVLSARLLGQGLVLWRNKEGGALCAWRDLCVHRGAKLSQGRVQDECLVCPYHGWNYDASGRCVKIPAQPSQPPPARAQATVYRVTEKRMGLGMPRRPRSRST